METKSNNTKSATCYGCLKVRDEEIFHKYNIFNETLKAVFQMDIITLCFSCYQRAEQAELFIKTVQENQVQLHTFLNKTNSTERSITSSELKSLKNLTQVHLQHIELSGLDLETKGFYVYNNNNIETGDMNVKLEVKEENDELTQSFDDEYVLDDTDLPQIVKEEDEDDYPLKMLKVEPELAGVIETCLRKSTRNAKISEENKLKTKRKPKDPENTSQFHIETIPITREQCMEERVKMASNESYRKSEFKCTDCFKGFTYKTTYEKHMEKHDPSAGDFECDICKQRTDSREKLKSHKRYHNFRFRCMECGIVRKTRISINEHYTSVHRKDSQFTCPHCSKIFKCKVYLRKHLAYKHRAREGAQCEHCNKVFTTKNTLRNHISGQHSSGVTLSKRHVCEDCGEAFRFASMLKSHAIKHTDKRDYYCVECDKSFKSENILNHHLRTAMPHVKYIELPFPCEQCDKRFAIRRDIERHMNSIHLNIKPYKCDQCDRAYVEAFSLTKHKRLIHEGYKRPRKYPCTMCDKVFDRACIRMTHMRTHTGERPYKCSECPAQFAQSGVLRTHVKLIHLKLTRDGRPKETQGRSRARL